MHLKDNNNNKKEKYKMKMCLSLTVVLLTLWGCAAGPGSGSTEQTSSQEPEWWFNPAVSETHYYSFGQAKKQNPSLAQKTAKQRASQGISEQVRLDVTGYISDMMQESGIGESAQALEFTENTTVGVTKSSLDGAVADKYFKAKDGTVYVRVSYSKDTIQKKILNATKREEALYNEFKATQAFEKLEKKVSGM
jgi:hypothetical protein